MQALTGMFAKQFGTPNYAAHGGFCSVNMAAGLIYTIGGSFWEFGGPDLERAKLFIMIGTAEDHHSNPMKVELSKFKRRGGRFISINPIRTGYSAIADEWVPIKPGTDGALILAIIRELIQQGLYDREFLVQYSNAAELVINDPSREDHGLFKRVEMHIEEGCFDPENKLWWDRDLDVAMGTHTPGCDPYLLGEFELEDGTPVKPSFQLLKERVEDYTPEWAEDITGIPAETIRRLAYEMGVTARDQKQACLRPRDRFWDIPVPKIDSAFDNLLVPQPSWSPSTTQQLRKLVAAPYLSPNDWTPRSEAYFVFPLAQGTPGKQCGLAATGVYQPSLRSPWLAAIELPIQWTDCWGNDHDTVKGNPVAFHSMRGLAAHSNGFHSIRALGILMTLLGTIDRPGGFRHKAPFPRPIPPCPKPPKGPEDVQPETPLNGMPLGWPADPNDLFVDEDGEAVRLDKAFSWEYPLSVHGLMHNAITNAWRGDPYKIDTLLIFMANMAWNSSMNTSKIREMLVDRDENGEYRIPFLIVADAFQSETVAFADLVLPDTTYLERHDAMSMLDRPISEYDGPVDSVRIPVVPPRGECKPFQEVLIEMGSRLKLPAFVDEEGKRKFRDYPDFVVNFETSAGSGIGFLAGWRGKGGEKFLKGEPNPRQWEMYAKNNCVFHYKLPRSYQYMRNWNKGYLEWARAHAMTRYAEPITVHLYSEVLQKFRLAAQGKRPGKQPPERLRKRVEMYFDPLPFYHETLESRLIDTQTYPLNALTQRPMAMYHSWDSQNAWLRQIHTHNYLFVNPMLGKASGFHDGDWVWVESPHGKVRCMARFSNAVEPGTVWTWNAIGKAAGAWGLTPRANESQKGFLLNHVISEELPACEAGEHMSNSDPVTGQAAWFDVRVRVYKAGPEEPRVTSPQFVPQRALPGQQLRKGRWQAYFAGVFRKKAGISK